jgi:hypothetical protein
MECSDVKKIPKDIINVIRKNRIKNYDVNINPYVPLNKQELKEETKAILSLLYRKFLCDTDKKQEAEEKFAKKLKAEMVGKQRGKERGIVEEVENNFESFTKENKLSVKKESWLAKILKWLKITTK